MPLEIINRYASRTGRGCGEHGDLSPVTPIGQPRATAFQPILQTE